MRCVPGHANAKQAAEQLSSAQNELDAARAEHERKAAEFDGHMVQLLARTSELEVISLHLIDFLGAWNKLLYWADGTRRVRAFFGSAAYS